MYNKTRFTSHSQIYEYPPNPINFPNFYNCKEEIFILNPGDMLYIPPKWFHWVFSYGNEDRENLAISYNIFNLKNKNVLNEFSLGKPFTINLKDEVDYKLSLKNLSQEYIQPVHYSKSNTLVPVQKSVNKTIYKKMFIKDIIELHKKQTYNIYIGQKPINTTLGDKIPSFISDSFPTDKINSYLWFSLLKNDTTYIESGLHYDITHNILIQIKGTKLVRLFKPSDAKHLYLQLTYGLPLYNNILN
jgi:hypothetical protein